MKLGPVTKLDKWNMKTSKKKKKNDDDVMSVNYDVMVIFPIYGRFEAMVCISYTFINNNLLSCKNLKQN